MTMKMQLLSLDQLNPELCKVKIGSVVFNALGKDFLRLVDQRGFKIFLDLKLHDIPNTVHETILGFEGCSIELLTIHLSGGKKMITAAMAAAQDYQDQDNRSICFNKS